MTRAPGSLLEDPKIVPSEVYRQARDEAIKSVKVFSNINHPVVTELSNVVVQALTGLGFTKYLFIHTFAELPEWRGNFPLHNFRFPSLEEAFAVAQTVANECDGVIFDAGRRREVANQQAARAVVVSLYAKGCLLVDFRKDWARNS